MQDVTKKKKRTIVSAAKFVAAYMHVFNGDQSTQTELARKLKMSVPGVGNKIKTLKEKGVRLPKFVFKRKKKELNVAELNKLIAQFRK